MLVFVYGTLKKDFTNEHLLADQKFLGQAVTKSDGMMLYEENRYRYNFPALVRRQGAGQVYGELYEVSERCLGYLDGLEGVNHDPPLYTRETVTVRTLDGGEHMAFVYVYAGDTAPLAVSGACWPKSELARCEIAGKRLRQVEKENTTQGVRLWNKHENQWHSPCFKDAETLQRWATPRSKALGGNGKDMLWSPNHFEPRPDDFTYTATHFQLWDTHNQKELSPEFPNFRELVLWCETNVTLFSGEKVSADRWAKIFKSLD